MGAQILRIAMPMHNVPISMGHAIVFVIKATQEMEKLAWILIHVHEVPVTKMQAAGMRGQDCTPAHA
jgi:hypothetical protein